MDDEKTAGDELFIIGDIHGDLIGLNRELWAHGLLRSGRWRKGAHLVCVGDYTDRNRGGAAVLRLLRPLEEDGLITCLLGNHDVAMLSTALLLRRLGSLPRHLRKAVNRRRTRWTMKNRSWRGSSTLAERSWKMCKRSPTTRSC